jgi:hypothetical protein
MEAVKILGDWWVDGDEVGVRRYDGTLVKIKGVTAWDTARLVRGCHVVVTGYSRWYRATGEIREIERLVAIDTVSPISRGGE